MPPDYPPAKAWTLPGKVMYPGLGVIDWLEYLRTIQQPGRRVRVQDATRTLFLTNRRLFVLDEARSLHTDLPLRDVEDASVEMPPGKPQGAGQSRRR